MNTESEFLRKENMHKHEMNELQQQQKTSKQFKKRRWRRWREKHIKRHKALMILTHERVITHCSAVCDCMPRNHFHTFIRNTHVARLFIYLLDRSDSSRSMTQCYNTHTRNSPICSQTLTHKHIHLRFGLKMANNAIEILLQFHVFTNNFL